MNRLALILASACLIFGTAASAADFGADRHVARGLECASCHGPDMKNPETPDENTCLKCHNRDQSKMNVARRTCGYIGTQFWNQGRTQEIRERVLHL